MDIIWSYCLVAIITLVLVIIRLINNKILKNFMEEYPSGKKYVIFKKDFFFTVAKIATICTIIINVMTVYGHSRLNVSSIVMTILLITMCLLSGMSFVALNEDKHFNISGYELEESNIKDIKIKEGKRKVTCTILFNEEMNGYQGMEFYLFGKNRQLFIEQIEQI
ncbi:hypothetical protein [Niameybacter massiliensis]|uniref:hypothetical protein n=1 Tax=Niameybacter massiliensis TaxID=1658108 RepID=UPI0006B57092|nr:hypothetical protein [Niameybacter massiliensis]